MFLLYSTGISAAGAVGFGEPARNAVSGLRDLPRDLVAEGEKPAADHDRHQDDDDVLDGAGALLVKKSFFNVFNDAI